MRNSLLFVAIVFILPLLILACDNDSGNNSNVLTENDFATNSALRAVGGETTVVTFLESPNSAPDSDDTGTPGVDVIPYRFPGGTLGVCWRDDEEIKVNFVEVKDSEGNLVLSVSAADPCANAEIEGGTYTFFVHHAEMTEDTLPIFMTPDPDGMQQTKREGGVLNDIITSMSRLLGTLNISLHEEALAQTADDISILLGTRRCDSCDLSGADFRGQNFSLVTFSDTLLTGANLKFANLNFAVLNRVDFSNADLSSADLSDADIDSCTFFRAKMTGTRIFRGKVMNSSFEAASMHGVDLVGSDMQDSDLIDADMIAANLDSVNLSRSDLTGANLNQALIRSTILDFADLENVNLARADINGSTLQSAVLIRADLTNANLFQADLEDAVFREASLTNANLADANFTRALLIDAILTGANLTNTNFGEAIWCDECICDPISIGTCAGCPPAGDVCFVPVKPPSPFDDL